VVLVEAAVALRVGTQRLLRQLGNIFWQLAEERQRLTEILVALGDQVPEVQVRERVVQASLAWDSLVELAEDQPLTMLAEVGGHQLPEELETVVLVLPVWAVQDLLGLTE